MNSKSIFEKTKVTVSLQVFTIFRALNDREEIRNQFDSFVSSVNHIHHLVMGPDTDHPHIKVEENTKHLPTKEILQRLTSVTGGIQVMKRQNHEMNK